MSRKDIFYSGSVTNLPEYQSQKSLTNYRNSVMSLAPSNVQSRQGDVEAQESQFIVDKNNFMFNPNNIITFSFSLQNTICAHVLYCRIHSNLLCLP